MVLFLNKMYWLIAFFRSVKLQKSMKVSCHYQPHFFVAQRPPNCSVLSLSECYLEDCKGSKMFTVLNITSRNRRIFMSHSIYCQLEVLCKVLLHKFKRATKANTNWPKTRSGLELRTHTSCSLTRHLQPQDWRNKLITHILPFKDSEIKPRALWCTIR